MIVICSGGYAGLVVSLGLVAGVVGEDDLTSWLGTLQCQILGYTQKSEVVATVPIERCLYVP